MSDAEAADPAPAEEAEEEVVQGSPAWVKEMFLQGECQAHEQKHREKELAFLESALEEDPEASAEQGLAVLEADAEPEAHQHHSGEWDWKPHIKMFNRTVSVFFIFLFTVYMFPIVTLIADKIFNKKEKKN